MSTRYEDDPKLHAHVSHQLELLSRRLSELRTSQRPKVSQEALAEMIGYAHSTVRSIETGQRVPSIEYLLVLLFILDERLILPLKG
jgi:transcriptional regulator with XRE-family HTH domain